MTNNDKQIILDEDIVKHLIENTDNKLVLKLTDTTEENKNQPEKQISWYKYLVDYLIRCFESIFKKPFVSTANGSVDILLTEDERRKISNLRDESVDILLTEEERRKIADLRVESMTKKYPRRIIKPIKKKLDNDTLIKKYEQIVLDWCE